MITDYFPTTSQSGKNNHAKQIRHNLIFFQSKTADKQHGGFLEMVTSHSGVGCKQPKHPNNFCSQFSSSKVLAAFAFDSCPMPNCSWQSFESHHAQYL